MCDPITATAVTLTVASGAYSAYGQYQEGIAQSKYHNYLAAQSEEQGKAALARGELQSKLIQDTAKEQAKRLKTGQSEFNASQLAKLSKNNVSGVTAEDVAGNSFNKELLDEQTLRYNANVQSWETEADSLYANWEAKTQASQQRYAAANAKSAGKRQAFGTLLGTAASVASMGTMTKSPTQGSFSNTQPYKMTIPDMNTSKVKTKYSWGI